MSDCHSVDQRLVDLELIITHLQHDLDQLNTALIEQQRQIDLLTRSLERINERIDGLQEGDEERSPQTERPPHY